MATLQHEWVASPAPLNCVALGRSLVATGGKERRCSVWRLTGQHLHALSGSSSPITCLDLDAEETVVLSGCEGGSARVYDLREGKAVRNLTGHRNQINCCRHHPFGEFVATGGADSTVKVWDARKKACLRPIKGTAARSTPSAFLLMGGGLQVLLVEMARLGCGTSRAGSC